MQENVERRKGFEANADHDGFLYIVMDPLYPLHAWRMYTYAIAPAGHAAEEQVGMLPLSSHHHASQDIEMGQVVTQTNQIAACPFAGQ